MNALASSLSRRARGLRRAALVAALAAFCAGCRSVPPPTVPPVNPPSAAPKKHTAAPANGSTLQGKFEEWGLAGKKLKSATLSVEGISVSDLKAFLMRLPSKYKASMEVEEEP